MIDKAVYTWDTTVLNQNIKEHRNTHWLSNRFELICWALTAHFSAQHFPTVELNTDEYGKHILVDVLGLPFTHTVVSDYSNYPRQIWAYCKILSYARQTEPFVHIDNDALFWEKPNHDILNAPLVVQNIENESWFHHIYRKGIDDIYDYQFSHLPAFLNNAPQAAYNLGLYGVNNLELNQLYTSQTIKFIENNFANPYFSSHDFKHHFSCIFEQYFLAAAAHSLGVQPYYLFPGNNPQEASYNYSQNADLNHRFTHLWGSKKKWDVYRRMEIAAKAYIPNYVKKIDQFLSHA